MNFLRVVFTPEALKNIERSGNVWGQTTEYDFKFSIRIWRRVFDLERRSDKNFWGRHGGGWNVKVGLQATSWKNVFLLRGVIFSFGGTIMRVREYARGEG